MKLKNIKSIFAILLFISVTVFSQQTPANKETKSILIVGATAHIGNGKVINNSAIGFTNGKINYVGTSIAANKANYNTVIDATGKDVYPGFIAPNTTLGLVEIAAVRATHDDAERGDINPNVRSIIAYNAESKIVESMRPNGVLIAQVAPRGGAISGTSTIVQLDAWNWEDAILKEDDGVHLNWPRTFRRSYRGPNAGKVMPNKNYNKQISKLGTFFNNALAYSRVKNLEKNLKFEAVKGLFNGNKRLYVHANDVQAISDAVKFVNSHNIKKMVIVGGTEAYKVSGLLKQNNVPVLLKRLHSLPNNVDEDIDLPFRLPKILTDAGILVGLQSEGQMERMNTRNLPFYAGTAVAYGLTYEQGVALITLNNAKILGMDKSIGSLEVGKDATLFISTGDALDMRTNNAEKAFIQGRDISLDSHQKILYRRYMKKYHGK
ncbi:MAG: amidohydrolase family protein [Flavobacteriaceae bacterium]